MVVTEPRTSLTTLAQLVAVASKADPSDLEAYFREAQKFRLNGVHIPFWRNIPMLCPSRFLTPEMLHYFHKEFWDHDCKWCINALGPEEIDFRFSVLQPVTGFCHFKEGISSLKQVTGRTHRDVQRSIIGVIAVSAPRNVVIAVRALMDFRYRVQAYRITEKDLELISSALHEFHSHKHSILDAGLRRGTANKPICQVRVYSGRGSGQVQTKTDRGRRQRAGQEVSPARVGDHVDSTTKDNER